ncbi:MAG: hypothetical protein K5681_04670 [Treponema sp.]|nr:hypothetical protein [Treponema sp.]
MKKIFVTIFTLFTCISLFAAAPTAAELANLSLNAYRNALYSFDSMDYGKALKYSEDAILFRKQQLEKEKQTLKDSLSAKRVRDAGDSIYAVLDVLESRKEKESIRIINTYLKKKGNEYFDNSITKLREYMNSMVHYPEAHKLIGDIYRLEGEYKFAEDYYLLALSNEDVLDVPDEKYEILYMLAEISRLQNDLQKMEVRLLNILTLDEAYNDKALKSSMLHTISTNKSDSMEKFFSLYRAQVYYSMDAYTKLADYYYDAGAKDRAMEFTSLAVICGFSKILETLQSRNSNYEYTNLASFFQELSYNTDIVEWGNKNLLWKNFNFLAKLAHEDGHDIFARGLLSVLVRWCPERYWQKEAVLLLSELGL